MKLEVAQILVPGVTEKQVLMFLWRNTYSFITWSYLHRIQDDSNNIKWSSQRLSSASLANARIRL